MPAVSSPRARQRTKLIILAIFLIVCGVLLLFVLKRAPLPMRILGGLFDLLAGAVLLVVVRQKFSTEPTPLPEPNQSAQSSGKK